MKVGEAVRGNEGEKRRVKASKPKDRRALLYCNWRDTSRHEATCLRVVLYLRRSRSPHATRYLFILKAFCCALCTKAVLLSICDILCLSQRLSLFLSRTFESESQQLSSYLVHPGPTSCIRHITPKSPGMRLRSLYGIDTWNSHGHRHSTVHGIRQSLCIWIGIEAMYSGEIGRKRLYKSSSIQAGVFVCTGPLAFWKHLYIVCTKQCRIGVDYVWTVCGLCECPICRTPYCCFVYIRRSRRHHQSIKALKVRSKIHQNNLYRVEQSNVRGVFEVCGQQVLKHINERRAVVEQAGRC